MAIDWDFLKDCYNRQNGSGYNTPKELLKALYAEHETCSKVASVLLLAANTVWAKMRAEKIALKPKGNRGIPKGEIAIMKFGTKRIKNMTGAEVAEEIGFSVGYTKVILEKKQIPYKKKWEWKNK